MLLEVKELTKSYGRIKSVDGVTFAIGGGEVVGLLGPNGAGKTTTIRMLAGYVAPTSGSVMVMGRDAFDEPIEARRCIGYLPELPPVYEELTVREHLTFVCGLRGVKNAADEINQVCGRLNIHDAKERVIKNLSKGYRQRVGFAGALIGGPKLLILDEPTVGLDPRQIIDVRELIKDLSSDMSVLISSHILSEISSVCTRLLIMNKGRLLADGAPGEIKKRYGSGLRVEVVVRGDFDAARAALGSCDGVSFTERALDGGELSFCVTSPEGADPRAAIFASLAERKDALSVVTLRSVETSLEDVFIAITAADPAAAGEMR